MENNHLQKTLKVFLLIAVLTFSIYLTSAESNVVSFNSANAPLYYPLSVNDPNYKCGQEGTAPKTSAHGLYPVLIGTNTDYSVGSKLEITSVTGKLCVRVATPYNGGWCKTCGCRNVPNYCGDIQRPFYSGLIDSTDSQIKIGFYSSNVSSTTNTPIAEYPLSSFTGEGITIPSGTKYIFVYYHEGIDSFFDNNVAYEMTLNYEITEGTKPQCSDGLDNDLDGVIDEVDPGCWDDQTDHTTFNPELDNEGLYDPTCTQNSDCSDDVDLGSVCQDGDVYDLTLKSTCQDLACVGETVLDLAEECDNGCENGTCIPDECVIDSDCGNNEYSDNYCGEFDDVYRDYTEYNCNQGVCEEETTPEIVDTCLNYCEDDGCVRECSENSECGEDYYSQNYCYTGDVYKDFHNYSCALDACNEDTERQLVQDCLNGCTNGVCDQLPACDDGLDNDDDGLIDTEDPGCDDSNGGSEIDCYTNVDCGIDSFIIGTDACQGTDLYADHSYHICENPGENSAQCTIDIFKILKQDCGESQCTAGAPYCVDDAVYATQFCTEKGCSSNECTTIPTQTEFKIIDCVNGCENGACITINDLSGPLITLIAPEDGQTVSGDVDFNYTATDTSGVKNCSLVIDGQVENSTVQVNVTDVNTFVKSLDDFGEHTAKITCYDLVGNYEESQTITFNYTESSCLQNLDCGTIDEELICQGDEVVTKRTRPTCSLLSVCETNVTYEFVKECSNGCTDGHCNIRRGGGDSSKNTCDSCTVPIVVSTAPLLKANNTLGGQTLVLDLNSDNSSVLNPSSSEDTQTVNWWYILVILLIVGIIFVVILIIVSLVS